MIPFGLSLILHIHQQPTALFSGRRDTRSHVPLCSNANFLSFMPVANLDVIEHLKETWDHGEI